MRRSTISIRLPWGRGAKVAAYMLAMLLWRANRGAEDDLWAKDLLRRRRTTTGARCLERPRGFSSMRAHLPHAVEVRVAFLARGHLCASASASTLLRQRLARTFTIARTRTGRKDGASTPSRRAGVASASASTDGIRGRTSAARIAGSVSRASPSSAPSGVILRM